MLACLVKAFSFLALVSPLGSLMVEASITIPHLKQRLSRLPLQPHSMRLCASYISHVE